MMGSNDNTSDDAVAVAKKAKDAEKAKAERKGVKRFRSGVDSTTKMDDVVSDDDEETWI
jgi:hypothetical protein